MSGDIFGCHNLVDGATSIQWVEASTLVNIQQEMGQPHSRGLSGLKYQLYPGRKSPYMVKLGEG